MSHRAKHNRKILIYVYWICLFYHSPGVWGQQYVLNWTQCTSHDDMGTWLNAPELNWAVLTMK